MDYLILNAYLGIVSFLIGTIVLIAILKRKIYIRNIKTLTIIGILQFLIANIISLEIWRLWPFNFDPMVIFIFIPSLIAEVITIPICIIICRHIKKIRNHPE